VERRKGERQSCKQDERERHEHWTDIDNPLVGISAIYLGDPGFKSCQED
jgi:hypothetical protein